MILSPSPIALVLCIQSWSAFALQNLLPRLPTFGAPSSKTLQQTATTLENDLLSAIESLGAEGRLSNSNDIELLVSALENSELSIQRPAVANEVYGKWKLIHTTNAGTASPIQRKAVDSTAYDIYQNIQLSDSDNYRLIVSQVVKFSPTAELRVDALASNAAYPLAELTQRQGTGKILGLNILGVSLVGEDAQPDPSRPDSRIDFVFDSGNFDFNGVQIPYPVPFRLPLFRDAVKGWIDITYLSERLRISRGNKGTIFILLKEEEADEM